MRVPVWLPVRVRVRGGSGGQEAGFQVVPGDSAGSGSPSIHKNGGAHWHSIFVFHFSR